MTFSYTIRVVRSWESFFIYSLGVTSSVLWSYFILFITQTVGAVSSPLNQFLLGIMSENFSERSCGILTSSRLQVIPAILVTINKGFCDKNRKCFKREKPHHFIQPISHWLALNSIHKHDMQPVFIVRIGTFWHAMKRELYESVNPKWRRKY